MSLDILTLPENPQKVIILLKEGNPTEAKNVADRCLARGVPRTQLNSLVYDYLKPLCRQNLEKAKKLTEHFQEYPYCWKNWLPSEPQLTLKNPEPIPPYGRNS